MAGTNQITWADKVNTKTLDIPRINKIIDADLNEIKTKFNALDTIVTDPVTGLDAVKTDQTDVENIIAIEIPTQSDQFQTETETAFLLSKFTKLVSFDVTLEKSKVLAGEFSNDVQKKVTKPQYFFGTISKTLGIDENVVKMHHSSPLTPSILVDVVDEDWGTKPEWLIVTGDTYLEGEQHRNILKFTYYEDVTIDTVDYSDVVVCEIKAIADGNMDLAIPDFSIANLQFNSEKDLTVDPTLPNISFWGQNELANVDVVFPANTAWIDLGGGNKALRTNTTGFNSTGGVPIIALSPETKRLLAKGEITIITRWGRTNIDATSNTFMCTSYLSDLGFRFSHENTDSRMNFRIGANNQRSTSNAYTIELDKFVCMAVSYSATTGEVKFYIKSGDYTTPIPFTLINTLTGLTGRVLTDDSINQCILNQETTAITPTGKRANMDFDYFYLIPKVLTDSQIDNLMTE